MNSYRLYILNPKERIADAHEGPYADDDAALAQASAMSESGGAYAVEVWTGERLVGRVGGEFDPLADRI